MSVFSIEYDGKNSSINYSHIEIDLLVGYETQIKEFRSGNFCKDWFDMIKFMVKDSNNNHFVGSSSVDHFRMDGGTKNYYLKKLFVGSTPTLRNVQEDLGITIWVSEELKDASWEEVKNYYENY